jgi:hypothetical protein
MKNFTFLSVLAASLFGAVSSFAQTSNTNQSPAFGYPSYAAPGSATRSPTTGTEGTFAPDFKGYPEPNTPPVTSGQTYSPSSEKRVPDVVGR